MENFCIFLFKVVFCLILDSGGEQGGGRPGEKGAGGVREAGEKRINYTTLHNISQLKKCKGAGTGIERYGKREV